MWIIMGCNERAAEAGRSNRQIHYVLGWEMQQNYRNKIQYFNDEQMIKHTLEFIETQELQRLGHTVYTEVTI